MGIPLRYFDVVVRADIPVGAVRAGSVHGHGEHMVQMGVEQALFRAVRVAGLRAGDLHLAQHVIPSLLSLCAFFGELPARHLCLHVPLGLRGADRGYAHLHLQRRALFAKEGQDSAHVVAGHCLAAKGTEALRVPDIHINRRLAGFHIEIHRILAVPAYICPRKPPGECNFALALLDIKDHVTAPGVVGIFHVHRQGKLPVLWQRIAVVARAHVACQLCLDAACAAVFLYVVIRAFLRP